MYDDAGAGAAAGMGAGMMILYFAVVIFMLIVWWKIFVKAGKPGWACLIPSHNIVLIFDIVGRPGWWWFLLLIPIVNIIILIMVIFDFAKAFGKGVGFGFGLLLLGIIFYPILAFGKAEYQQIQKQPINA